MSEAMPTEHRDFDIALLGATGFTGGLVAGKYGRRRAVWASQRMVGDFCPL